MTASRELQDQLYDSFEVVRFLIGMLFLPINLGILAPHKSGKVISGK
jgi:hypothetical protein